MRALLLLFSLLVIGSFAATPKPPTWPEQYYVRGNFLIPYWNLNQPTEMYYDGVNNRQRIDYYYGMDSYVMRYDQNMSYEVVPRVDDLYCFENPGAGTLVTLLPDLSSWSYNGTYRSGGASVNMWTQTVQNLNRTNEYAMLVNSETGAPVELYMQGYDFVFGSHPDIYIFTYQYYSTWSNASVYNKPTTCSTKGRHAKSRSTMWRAREMLGRLQQLHPEARPINDEFDLFATRYAKHYPTIQEREQRRSTFQANSRMIDEHNARTDVTYRMGMNHFGDMSADEMRELVYPRNDRARKYHKEHPAPAVHTKRASSSTPASVNWVEKGAVNPPKDQGICGSCWTFGTIGSIEGTWAVKTGKLLSLSEQQLVDCAWTPWNDPDSANLGCDGGYAAQAMQWAISNGGLASEMSYPYLMQDHWCQAGDVSSGVKLKGYVNVSFADEAALQDAVATAGPVAIAIDAMYPSLTFYQSGVYSDPNCKSDLDSLDHEVLAVGYGTTESGQQYWLIKNSWSTHWGDNGYVYMLRGQNMCGVASQATYPTF